MPWWGKSTKKGKRKARKICVVDMSHGKLRIVSAEKGGRPGTSRRHYLDIVSENADHSGVYNQHPSHFLRVSSSRSFSEKSSAQPVQLQGGQSSATQLVRSKIDISMRTGCERVCWPSVLGSLYEPGRTVDTQDGKYIVMEFKTASDLEGNKTTRKAASNCPSSLKLKDNSAIASKQNSREILRTSSLLLNNQGVSLSSKRQPRGSNVLNI
ncbi:hypothetical protein LIER_11549 [Lithospermum erythrorhizon]|uniref:Uncharacterized protein n=1 Tax=Lithospermum erythrorhizon TaxID=34254 RepID=A0AAV3PQA2_LITER